MENFSLILGIALALPAVIGIGVKLYFMNKPTDIEMQINGKKFTLSKRADIADAERLLDHIK